MDWRQRMRELVLAGGTLGLGACLPFSSGGGGAGGTGGPPGIPCGNANPDPCICGRPEADPTLAKQCDLEMACQADGGVWNAFYQYGQGNALVAGPHCDPGDGGPGADAAAGGADGGDDAGDGSMNGSD